MSQPASLPLVASLLDAPLPASGIAWLDASRRENRAAFAASGLPDARVEAWKYTALRGLGQRSFAGGDAAAATRVVDAATLALPGVAPSLLPDLCDRGRVVRLCAAQFDHAPSG